MNIKNILNQKEYDFLRNSDYYKELIFITFGGSIAYGTNIEGSDIDIRGITLNNENQLLGLPSVDIGNIEQYINEETDTTIYTLKKIIKLFIGCNPNTIEMLYTKPEHQIYNNLGKILVDNRDIFLSQRAAHSFNGYAISQLHRLKNALSKEGKLSLKDELEYERSRLNDMVNHFNSVYSSFENKQMSFVIKDDKLKFNCNLTDYPTEDIVGILEEIKSTLRSWKKYAKLTEREKDARKLNKHAMHLIRLYLMGIEILSGKKVNTYRGFPEEHELLMKVRNGYFMKDDGSYDPVFFEIVDDFQKNFEYAKKHTVLPEKCNMEAVNELFIDINKKGLLGNKMITL